MASSAKQQLLSSGATLAGQTQSCSSLTIEEEKRFCINNCFKEPQNYHSYVFGLSDALDKSDPVSSIIRAPSFRMFKESSLAKALCKGTTPEAFKKVFKDRLILFVVDGVSAPFDTKVSSSSVTGKKEEHARFAFECNEFNRLVSPYVLRTKQYLDNPIKINEISHLKDFYDESRIREFINKTIPYSVMSQK